MHQLEELFNYVDDHKEAFLNDLEAFCACQSVAGNPKGLEDMRQCLVNRMEAAGIETALHPVEGGNALVTGEKKGEQDYTVLFYNHYDVVEPGDPARWTSGDPFMLTRDGDRLLARGVSDDKGPLLSRIHAVETILRMNGSLPVNVRFLAEGDEETSSPSMFRFLRENEDEFREMTRSDLCFWENGRRDSAGRPWARYGVRGACGFNLRVRTADKDVHGRMGATIPSASWRLTWALSTLKSPDERIQIEGFYDDVKMPGEREREVLSAFPYEEDVVREKLGIREFLCGATGYDLKERIYYEPTLSICGIEAGELHKGPRGIVPCTAWARLSFYLVAGQDPERIHRLLRAHLDRHGFEDVEVEYLGGTYPVKTEVDLPVTEHLRKATEKAYGVPMVIEPTQLGSGPAIALRKAWPDLPVIGIGPGNNNGNHHAPDENLIAEDYLLAVKQIIAFLYEMGGIQK